MIDECPTCYGPCDPQIHAATLSIHGWLKERIELVTRPFEYAIPKHPKPPKKPRDIRPDYVPKLARPRPHKSSYAPTGNTHAWNRRDDLPAEKILELRMDGKEAKEIATMFGVRFKTLYRKLARESKRNPAFAMKMAALEVCPGIGNGCGMPKRPTEKLCSFCKRGKKPTPSAFRRTGVLVPERSEAAVAVSQGA